MKKTICCCCTALTLMAQAQTQLPMQLRYNRPAEFFEESLPIGNGKMGALVYGGIGENVIQLNDITLWTGRPVDPQTGQGASQWLPKIREALFNEDYAAADSLQLHLEGPNSQFYQPLGTLKIRDLNGGQATGYHRQLDLDSAIVSDSYTVGGTTNTREYFASNPDRLIAICLRGNVNVALTLTGLTPHKAKASNNQITMTGHAVGDPQESIHFCTILKATTDGSVTASDSTLTISNAKEATLYIVNATSFNGFDKHPVSQGAPYLENAANDIWHTENISYDEIRKNHVSDYQRFYDRVKLRLWGNDKVANKQLAQYQKDLGSTPTDELLKQYNDQPDRSVCGNRYLETLYFQYGRYLLIASSRTPGVPANLQGLWTPHLWSPWRGNYTVNINLEENYWPVFVSNLAEMAEPLDGFVAALAKNGHSTAKNFYGVEQGWCSSHNSDIWAMTNPVGENKESPMWSCWNMGGAWLVNTLWEHYLFTRDQQYLFSTALPLMQGAADFCMGWLIANPNNPKELITAPSTSPENEYVTDKGYRGTTCYGGTADLAIIRELLENTRQATTEAIGYMETMIKEQQVDSAQTAALRQVIGILAAYRLKLVMHAVKLHPYTVGKEGDLNEWYHDWKDRDPHHRHQSHLIGLYPGQHYLKLQHLEDDAVLAVPNQLSKEDYMKACEQTLIQKGDQTTGWSTGWRINLWARLRKAPEAYHIYQKLLTYVTPDNYKGADRRHSGGTYPNLMDAHPPFQIDGNFGGTAGVCEMLLQSGDDWIELLPALPAEWSDGEVKGLRARGGYTIDMAWANGQVTTLTIRAQQPGSVRLTYNGAKGRTEQRLTFDNQKAGLVYQLKKGK